MPQAWAQIAPTVVFQEDFENGMTQAANGAKAYQAVTYNGSMATAYVGATGQTYLGSAAWINGTYCNGVILSANNSTLPGWAATETHCRALPFYVNSYGSIRTLARAMGSFQNNHAGTTALWDQNHIVSSYTECPGDVCGILPSGSVNGIMFQTASLIPVTPNRFYTFSVDAVATGCTQAQPGYQFQLLDALGVATNLAGVINPCSGADFVVPNLSGVGSPSAVARAVRGTSAVAIKYTGTQLRIRMYNTNGASMGNDGSFDNVRLLDVTPRLSKAFSPASVQAGSTSTLTFTVTNTTDLLAKTGWQFTDNLPAGLVLDGTAVNPVGTCTNSVGTAGTEAGLVGASIGATSITVQGSLPAGASCTVVVPVRVLPGTPAGTLQNCGANFSGLSYVDPPQSCANLQVTSPVTDLSITKTSNDSVLFVGQTTVYQIVVNNAGPSAAHGATVSDPAAPGLDCVTPPAALTCGNATGGAVCPASPAIANFQNPAVGVPIPTFPAGGAVTFNLTCTVTGP